MECENKQTKYLSKSWNTEVLWYVQIQPYQIFPLILKIYLTFKVLIGGMDAVEFWTFSHWTRKGVGPHLFVQYQYIAIHNCLIKQSFHKEKPNKKGKTVHYTWISTSGWHSVWGRKWINFLNYCILLYTCVLCDTIKEYSVDYTFANIWNDSYHLGQS